MKKVYSFFRTLAILYDAFFFNNTKKNIFAYSAQVKKDYKY